MTGTSPEFSTHTKVSKQGNQNVCVQQASNIHPEHQIQDPSHHAKSKKPSKRVKGKNALLPAVFKSLRVHTKSMNE